MSLTDSERRYNPKRSKDVDSVRGVERWVVGSPACAQFARMGCRYGGVWCRGVVSAWGTTVGGCKESFTLQRVQSECPRPTSFLANFQITKSNPQTTNMSKTNTAATNETYTTQGAVAKSLGVTGRMIRKWREDHHDAPAKVDKQEPLHAWQAFVERKGLSGLQDEANASLEAMKIEEQRLRNLFRQSQIDLNTEKLLIMTGAYIPRAEIEAQLAPLIAEFQMLVTERDIEMSNWSPGHTTGEIRVRQRTTLDAVFDAIRSGAADLMATAQSNTKKMLANEATPINAPGQGRPKSATRKPAKKAAKRKTKRTK